MDKQIDTYCIKNDRQTNRLSRKTNRLSRMRHSRSYRGVYVSFGGLLMRIQGDANNLHGIEMDQNLYLLMKKLAF